MLDLELAERTLRAVKPSAGAAALREEEAAVYTCFDWVREGFERLHGSGALKSYFDEGDWREVEGLTREYVREKRAVGRLEGRAEGEGDVPTYCAWQYREITA